MRATMRSIKFRIWLATMGINYCLFIFGKLSEAGFIQLYLFSMGIMFVVNVAEKYVVGEKVKVDI